MAAVVGMAGSSLTAQPTLGAARRRRQQLAKEASLGKLAAAFAHIAHLEQLLAEERLAWLDVVVADEAEQRLALIRPVVQEQVDAAANDRAPSSPPLQMMRRNAAAHCFDVPAAEIRNMNKTGLNAAQRKGRRGAAHSRRKAASPETAGRPPQAAAAGHEPQEKAREPGMGRRRCVGGARRCLAAFGGILQRAWILSKLLFEVCMSRWCTSSASRSSGISVVLDTTRSTITIEAPGLSMPKNQLARFLGTIVKSGTHTVMEAMAAGGPITMKGQFGCVFYSADLVSHKVCVVSKHNERVRYIWDSSTSGTSALWEHVQDRYCEMPEGILIICEISKDRPQFLEERELARLIQQYSEFIGGSIQLFVDEPQVSLF